MSCNCTAVMEYLASIGAAHAAKMHGANAASAGDKWTAQDWRAHIKEEREILWPRVLAVPFFVLTNHLGQYERVPSNVLITQLEMDHVDFERELSDNGSIVNTRLLEAHSALEDAIVMQLRK
jgi:hypothetical protein